MTKQLLLRRIAAVAVFSALSIVSTAQKATNAKATIPTTATVAPNNKLPPAIKSSDIKGTYVCVSGGVPELMTDGTISKASVDAAQATIKSYGSATKYLFRGDGTFADLTWGEKYAKDPKYNGTYKMVNGKMEMYSGGYLFYTFQPARNEQGNIALIQVHEAKDRYKAQFCQLVK